MGIECTVVDLFDHRFKYRDVKRKSFLMKIKRLIMISVSSRQNSGENPSFFVKCWRRGWWLVLNTAIFLYAVARYDVFILGFNSSFLWCRGLPILRYLNKKIICRFHGADLRPPYLSGGIAADAEQFNVADCIRLAAEKKSMVRKIQRHADVIISNPVFSHFLERRFISATRIGLPCSSGVDQASNYDTGWRAGNEKVRVIHAPSHTAGKGTKKIRDMIRTLENKGYALEYIEIEGKPNSIVLSELSRCDFAIDQLYSDTPMAGFAAEAATFCKPTVVGGYAKELFTKIYPQGRIPPSFYCHPEDVEIAIERLIQDKKYRITLGREAKEFVDAYWSAQRVAERYLKIIKNEIPREWWYNPYEIEYFHGSCLSEERTKEVIRSIVESGGQQALQLYDKPKLERIFLDFAYSGLNNR
jgi:hypothetical protein